MDRDYDLFDFAVTTGSFYRDQCALGIKRRPLAHWVGHVQNRVAPAYCRQVERMRFTRADVLSAANMLKVYYEDHMAKEGLAVA